MVLRAMDLFRARITATTSVPQKSTNDAAPNKKEGSYSATMGGSGREASAASKPTPHSHQNNTVQITQVVKAPSIKALPAGHEEATSPTSKTAPTVHAAVKGTTAAPNMNAIAERIVRTPHVVRAGHTPASPMSARCSRRECRLARWIALV